MHQLNLSKDELAFNAGVSTKTIARLLKREGITHSAKRGSVKLYSLKEVLPFFPELEAKLKHGTANKKPKPPTDLVATEVVPGVAVSQKLGQSLFDALMDKYEIDFEDDMIGKHLCGQLAFTMSQISTLTDMAGKDADNSQLIADRSKLTILQEKLIKQLEAHDNDSIYG